MTQKCVDLYTDGGCSGNPGPGGWGAILRYNGNEKELSGNHPETTNNQMEMLAIINGLRALKHPCHVNIYTDSTYVMKGMTEWIEDWKANNWKTSSNKPVKNKELWEMLETETNKHSIEWHWVKGHDGHEYNERADELAVQAYQCFLDD